MYSRVTKIVNQTGLHARPASQFTALANKHNSKIEIAKTTNNLFVDAKSIIMLLTTGFCRNEEIVIRAEGNDEIEAVDSLIELVNNMTE